MSEYSNRRLKTLLGYEPAEVIPVDDGVMVDVVGATQEAKRRCTDTQYQLKKL